MLDHRFLTIKKMIQHVRDVTDIDCLTYDSNNKFQGLALNVSAIGMSISTDSSKSLTHIFKMCLDEPKLKAAITEDIEIKENLHQIIKNLHTFDINNIGFENQQAFMQNHYCEYVRLVIAYEHATSNDYSDITDSLGYLIAKSMSPDNKPDVIAQEISEALQGNEHLELKQNIIRYAYEYLKHHKKEAQITEQLIEFLADSRMHPHIWDVPSEFHEQMLFYTISLGEHVSFNYLFQETPSPISDTLGGWDTYAQSASNTKNINPLFGIAASLYPDTLQKLNMLRDLSDISYSDAFDIYKTEKIKHMPLPELENDAWT